MFKTTVTACCLICLLFPAAAFSGQSALSEDEALFQDISRICVSSASRDAAIDALDKFIRTYPLSPRAADAQFMKGDALMAKGLELKRAAPPAKKPAAPGASFPGSAELNDAVKVYQEVIAAYKQSGLEASAQYRVGEAFYNLGDWQRAIKEFARVAEKYPASYAVPESLLGIIYADIALDNFSAARTRVSRLEADYPPYSGDPGTVFAKAVLALDEKNYRDSQKFFSLLDAPEARFFLGKTYIYQGKSYIAAGVFEALLKDYPATPLQEEVEFLTADSFFYARDYDGAVVKYREFLKNHPDSKLRTAAVFRVGASLFGKRDYPGAQANFQNILDKDPRDAFAPLAQYFIAEAYLSDKQTHNAVLAFTKVIDAYPDSSVVPAARYKLGWCQYLLKDYQQAARALEKFPAQHPGHALAQNALHLAGGAWLGLGKPAEAVRAFQAAMDLAPATEIAEASLYMMLKTEYESGKLDSMLTSYQFMFKSLPPASSKWRALSLLYVAEAYLAQNFTDEARKIFADIAAAYPNDIAAVYAQEGLAWSHALAGDPAAAVKAAEKLKALEAGFPGLQTPGGAAAMAIADGWFNRKEFEPAYQLYEKFAAENAQSPYAAAALYRAGLALYRLRYYSQAVELWTRLSTNYPAAPETEPADLQGADTWFRAQKYAEALGAYNAIIAKYPGNAQLPLARLRLAQIHYNLNEDAKALEQVKAVVKQHPAAPEAFEALDLAEVLFDRNSALDFKAFLLDLAAAKPRNKAAGEALFRLGRRQFERKDYAAAAENLEEFSVHFIDHASIKDAQFYLGEAEFQKGDMRNAARVFGRFADNYPSAKEHPLALFRLGNATFNLKRYRGAVTAYAKLAELYPDNEYVKPALFNLALAYKNTGDADKAEETYRKYFALASGSAEGLNALWEIFNLRKNKADPAGALELLTEIYNAAQGKEDALEALYQLGAVNLENKQTEEARGYWEKLALQRPANSAWRLQGLVKLGELYEERKDHGAAAQVYEDIAANASTPEVAKAAAERAKSLRRLVQKEAAQPAGN